MAQIPPVGAHRQGRGAGRGFLALDAGHADRVVGEDRQVLGRRGGNEPARLEVEELGELLGAQRDEPPGAFAAGGEFGPALDPVQLAAADDGRSLAAAGSLVLSYRQTIKAYPTAGGAYMVTRDNFGLLPAQVAGVALLTDYILTVAVSIAAGTAALASAFPALAPYSVPICDRLRLLIAFGNLRGVKESGKVFAVPTYFFIVNMVMLARGRPLCGTILRRLKQRTDQPATASAVRHGSAATASSWAPPLFVVLHAFASGGAAVTGVEAISNGVPAFRKPAVEERPQDPRHHGLRCWASCSSACRSWRPRSTPIPFEDGRADGDLPDRQAGLRRHGRRARAVLRAAGRHRC